MSAEKLATDVRQEQIAQAAMDLICSHGLRGLSVAGVAKRVGLVPSAIYRHFKGKDQILDAVLDLIHKKFIRNITAACEETKDPIKQLEIVLKRHIQQIQQNQAIPRLIFSEEFSIDHPERKIRVFEILNGYLKALAEIVERGRQEGCLRQDLKADLVALNFLGLIQPACILWYLSNGQFDINTHIERAWIFFRASIIAR